MAAVYLIPLLHDSIFISGGEFSERLPPPPSLSLD